jgi:hypothetical protein
MHTFQKHSKFEVIGNPASPEIRYPASLSQSITPSNRRQSAFSPDELEYNSMARCHERMITPTAHTD